MEHALHLAAKHFIERVAPTSTSALLKKTVEDDDDETDFDVADTVGKALSLVMQIRKSLQAHVFFKKCCTEVDISTLELLKWI